MEYHRVSAKFLIDNKILSAGFEKCHCKELEEFINWIIFDADNDDILEQALKIRTWKHKDFTEPMRNQNENKSNDKRP